MTEDARDRLAVGPPEADEDSSVVVLIDMEVEPRHAHELAVALAANVERYLAAFDGFVAATFLVSDDGRRNGVPRCRGREGGLIRPHDEPVVQGYAKRDRGPRVGTRIGAEESLDSSPWAS
jgi:hypothetical protein